MNALHAIWAIAGTALVKGGLLLALALVATRLVKRAAARHQILSFAMLGLIALPLFALLLPSFSLNLIPAGSQEMDPDFGAAKRSEQTGSATEKSPASQAGAQVSKGTDRFVKAWASPSFMGFLFLFGCSAMIVRMLLGLRAARSLARDAQPLSDPHWQALLVDASAQLDVRKRVTLRESAAIAVPLTLGVLKPCVLLPHSQRDWPEARRRLVLLHELAHVKRGDCALSLVTQLACALHFFNPLVWLAERLMLKERELAADDLVLTAGARPSSYASELLDVARALRDQPAQERWAVAMAGHTQLEGRLRRILDPRVDHRPLGLRHGIVTAGLALALVLPLSSLRGWAAPSAATAAGAQAAEKLRTDVTTHLSKSLGKRPARVELTIDPLAQSLVEQELDAIAQKFSAQRSSIVVLSPRSGAILGIGSRGGGTRLLAVDDVSEPASTIKVFTVATALEAGTITAEQSFSTASDASGVHDAAPAAKMTVADILALSSNIGTLKIYRTLGKERLLRGLARFHFGEAPPVQLDAAAGAPLRLDMSEEQAQAASFGHQITASPLQIAAAFAAVANHGAYQAPSLVSKAMSADGATLYQHTPRPEQIVKATTADTVLRMLEGVVQRDDGTGTNARVAGHRVAGKTGSGEKIGYFVGAVPAARPEVVILVAVAEPKSTTRAMGNVLAAPSFRRIAEPLLAARHVPATN